MNKTHTSNDFFEQVLEVVKQIPEGKVTSYGAIARFLGAASSSRMVGYALNNSGFNKINHIPAHRVVNRIGLLTGKAHFGAGVMEELLLSEGVLVKDNKVVDFENKFWDPEMLIK